MGFLQIWVFGLVSWSRVGFRICVFYWFDFVCVGCRVLFGFGFGFC